MPHSHPDAKGSVVTLISSCRTPSIDHSVDIPFDLMMEWIMFPAGNYMITPQADRIFFLRAGHGRASARFVAEPIRVPYWVFVPTRRL
jgi:hypothetical protein